jgi:hypothetical protein
VGDESFENAVPVADGPRFENVGAWDETPASGNAGPMPALDELIARIPAQSRALLEELFKAKFVGVRRINRGDLR